MKEFDSPLCNKMAYKNKEDQTKNAKLHYEANKAVYVARAMLHTAKARKRNYEYTWEYKSTHPCAKCGNTNPIVLDFHHPNDDKEKSVSKMMRLGWSIEKIKKEIEKCIVLCSNCHRIETYNNRKTQDSSAVAASVS